MQRIKCKISRVSHQPQKQYLANSKWPDPSRRRHLPRKEHAGHGGAQSFLDQDWERYEIYSYTLTLRKACSCITPCSMRHDHHFIIRSLDSSPQPLPHHCDMNFVSDYCMTYIHSHLHHVSVLTPIDSLLLLVPFFMKPVGKQRSLY